MTESGPGGPNRYRLDDLTVDTGKRLVSRDTSALEISGLTYDLLLAIVQAAPNIISYDELIDKVWSGRPTSPETITQRAMMLRQALGDSADKPNYVEVVRGQGFKLIPVVTSSNDKRNQSNNRARIGVVAAVLAVAALIFFIGPEPDRPNARAAPPSVAVLLFENLSPNPDDAFFAQGLHSEVLNSLGKVRNLTVIARTSVLQYAGTSTPIDEIAEELNVGAVMEGSVRYAEDQVRVTAQLNDGRTGEMIWSDTFTRDLENVFDIQSDIALSIANALEAELRPSERETIGRRPTRSGRAYAQFLRALDVWNSASFGIRAEFPEIEMHLNRAIEIDPTFARAYAVRALLYAVNVTADPTGQRVFDDANRALELDERLGVAHAALGTYFGRTWNGKRANESFQRALELSPGDEPVLIGYTRFLSNSGQHTLAIDLAQRLFAVAPNSEDSLQRVSATYRMAGEYDIAADYAQRSIESGTRQTGHLLQAAGIEVARGNIETALDLIHEAEESWDEAGGSGNFAYTYRLAGDMESAMRHAGERREPGASNGVPYGLAVGDYDFALEEIRFRIENKGYASGPYWLVRSNAWNDPVLEQPEWVEVREQMGYPDLPVR